MAISDYSTTAASNTSISGIDISGVTGKVKDGDNAIRQLMADIKAGVPYLSSSQYLFESTDAGAAAAPVLNLYRNSASPAASDVLAKVIWNGEDSGGNTQEYASVETVIVDATSTSEDGQLDFYVTKAGTRTKFASMTATATAFTGAAAYTVDATITPASSDGAALGTSSLMWSDLFLASGGVINFNAGDVTITHSSSLSGTLTFAGASNGFRFDNIVIPASDDGASLGSSNFKWSDLFLAEGGVISWDGGDLTLTQTGSLLRVEGGVFEVGTFSATGATAGVQVADTAGRINTSNTGTSSATHMAFYNANGIVGSIATAASATAFNTSSDENLKTNFRDFDPGQIIDALSVYHFDWVADSASGYGVKAQEAYGVFPDAVTAGSPQGEYGMEGYRPWGVDYSKFVPLLLREMQELRRRVARMEGE